MCLNLSLTFSYLSLLYFIRTQIADWRFPYKQTFHPVCILDRKRIRRIRLKHCDPDAPPELRYYQYVEALSCSCQPCQSSIASCEGVPFIGTPVSGSRTP